MNPSLVAQCSEHAILVRVRGLDSLGVKTLGRPFHEMNGGFTTLSASGLLLDRKHGYALTSATLLAPYMQGDSLRKGVIVEMLNGGLNSVGEDGAPTVKWIPMRLVRILKDESIHALLKRFRGDADWTAGWPRGSDSSSGHLGDMDMAKRESMSQAFWAGFEDVALLQIEAEGNSTGVRAKLSALRRDLQMHHPQLEFNVIDPSTVKKGNHLLLIASPYGILSPSVFHNCVYTSMVSNIINMDVPARSASSTASRSANSDAPEDFTSMLSRTPVFQYSAVPASPTTSTASTASNLSHGTALTSTIQQGKASRAKRLKSAVLANTVDRLHSAPLQTMTNNPCVILIDQAGLPGCEGGPVFDSQGSLLGLLAPPLRRSDGSNVEVHLVLPIYPFLQQLVREIFGKVPLLERVGSGFKLQPVSAQSMPSRPQETISSQAMRDSTQVISKALPSIAVISIGTFWGSGVVVSSDGYVLTSAHIFRSFLAQSSSLRHPALKPGYQTYIRIDSESLPVLHGPPSPSTFHYYDSTTPSSFSSTSGVSMILGGTRTLGSSKSPHWHKATLVYVSSSHLDVALVKIDTPLPTLSVLRICSTSPDGTPLEGCTKEPLEGEPVLALGFALFGPSKRIRATTTSGVVSRVAHLHGQPKLIQTSSSVNKGASGGALVDALGNFVGLVTCNAMTKDGIIIPKINFSLPANLLLPIDEFLHTKRWEALEAIERPDPECAALWSMSTLSEDSPSQAPPPIPDLASKIQQYVQQQKRLQQAASPPNTDTQTKIQEATPSSSGPKFESMPMNSMPPANTPIEERGGKLRQFWNSQLGSAPNALAKAKL